MKIVLSFDVVEHDRIEVAAGLNVGPALKGHYRERVAVTTRWLLDALLSCGPPIPQAMRAAA